MPAWGDLNELGGVMPLIKSLAADWAFITSIEILPLHPTQNSAALDKSVVARLISGLANLMPIRKFADSVNIAVATDLGT
jgi:hypothetical protein